MTRFGVHVAPQMCTIEGLREVWARSEELGFDWISLWDHFGPIPNTPDGQSFEAISCHAALAAVSVRPRVGCLVYSSGYRHPAVLASAGATIDHLSGGRLEMGMGAGWHEREYSAYGFPFEPPGVRLRRMAEAVEIVRLLWTQPTTTYRGEFWTLTDAHCHPRPIQSQPRIWIGARGEVALKLAGKIGDGWNLAFESPESFARKLDVVRASSPRADHVETAVNVGFVPFEGSSTEVEIRRRFGPHADGTTPGILSGSTEFLTDLVGRYVGAGAQWIILALRAPFNLQALQKFAAEVVPQFRSD